MPMIEKMIYIHTNKKKDIYNIYSLFSNLTKKGNVM